MYLKTFLEHWNIKENPFQAEEAKTDGVYLRTLSKGLTHPDFDKIFGGAREVSTAVVFGRKGSGKTAMRLLLEERYKTYNQSHPEDKVFTVRYDDLNPVFEQIGRRLRHGDEAGVINSLQLTDHQDAILARGVTALVDEVLGDQGASDTSPRNLRRKVRHLPQGQRLDLLMLAALYDQPFMGSGESRWSRLLRICGGGPFWKARRFFSIAGVAALGILFSLAWRWFDSETLWPLFSAAAFTLILIPSLWAGVSRYFKRLRIARRLFESVRVGTLPLIQLRSRLHDFGDRSLALAPLPLEGREESRYELTHRLMRLLNSWDYKRMVVLIDRVDEPQLINGDTEKMSRVIWPVLNNKFLQQDGVAFKLLLPIELGTQLSREASAFFQQARLDKQNLIRSLEWTGATLYDICSERLRACQENASATTTLNDLFEESVSKDDLISALDRMRQPRDAFKFLYGVLQEHCQQHPEDAPVFKISPAILDIKLREQVHRLENLNQGLVPA